MDVTCGFECLGHSNWTICSLLSQLCCPNVPTFFSLSYCRANSYYPREGMTENREKRITQPLIRQRGIALGILSEPFPACEANFVHQIFQLFHFYPGRPILITPERGRLKIGKGNSPEMDERQGFECLGHSNWTIVS